MFNSLGRVVIRGVIISVDRAERGTGRISALKEAENSLGLRIYPIVDIHQIVSYLASGNQSGFKLTEDLSHRISEYIKEYGA